MSNWRNHTSFGCVFFGCTKLNSNVLSIAQHGDRIALKVIPPTLLCYTSTELDVGNMVVEVEHSH